MASNDQLQVIAIDGPAGAGKSTVAKGLAKKLQFSYLDTGAMYRSLTLKAMRNNVDLSDEDALEALAKQTVIDLEDSPDGVKILLDGEDVSEDIRTVEVTNNTFYVARAPKVREVMVQMQRSIASKKSVVVEGRDTGSVVFPNATHKFYLDAHVNERVDRRHKELAEKGKEVDEKTLATEMKERDHKDQTREAGPLIVAEGAVVVDTTDLNVDQTVEKLYKHIQSHG